MKIKRKNLKDGSCNFCKRGKLNDRNVGMVYPYTKVTEMSSDVGGTSVRVCDECLATIKAEC